MALSSSSRPSRSSRPTLVGSHRGTGDHHNPMPSSPSLSIGVAVLPNRRSGQMGALPAMDPSRCPIVMRFSAPHLRGNLSRFPPRQPPAMLHPRHPDLSMIGLGPE
nr:unnamed protein product [Digitaria exilis]